MTVTVRVSKVLENAIVSVLETHNIFNWSIFGEKDGNINIKIRFNPKGEGQNSSEGNTQHIAYRRRNEKQLKRDRQRANKRKRVISPDSENSKDIESDRL